MHPGRTDTIRSPLRCSNYHIEGLTCGSFDHKRVLVTCGERRIDFWDRDGQLATSLHVTAKVQNIAWALPTTAIAATSCGFVAHKVWSSFPSSADRGVGVCLSGGGHRAALFGLGALLYIVDAGLNTRVRSIASVSGGSLLNAFVSQECDFGDDNCKEEFEAVAQRFARLLVTRSTFSKKLWVCLALVMLAPAVCLALGYPASITALYRILGAGLAGSLFLLRGHFLDLVLSRRFFLSDYGRTQLSDRKSTVEHVLCATDLAANEPFYFSTWNGGHAFTSTRGWSRLPGLPFSVAVRASAAFPGGFPPKRLRLVGTALLGSRFQFDRIRMPAVGFLSDGGVWNNLASDWMDGEFWKQRAMQARTRDVAPMPGQSGAPGQLVVVNASYPQPAKRGRLWALPYAAEVMVPLRVAMILFQNTIQPRIDALRAETRNRWIHKASTPGLDERVYWDQERRGVEVAVASIHESLHVEEVKKRHRVLTSGAPWVPTVHRYLSKRIRVATQIPGTLRFADGSSVDTRDVVRKDAAVPTTFGRMDRKAAALLIWHGYVATRNECHVAFGSPALSAPDSERIGRLVGL